MADAGLNFLARQMERLIQDVGSLRDDMRVLTAIVMRLDNSPGAMLQELRETHSQIAPMNHRIHNLEISAP
jgi:hypothetical protein